MNKSLNFVLATLLAGGTSLAVAQPGLASQPTRGQQFASDLKTLEQESTAMPAGSPPVDRNAKPDDPIPKATTPAQKEAWFRKEYHQLQLESTGMPAGSPPVDRYEKAADPFPNATTYAEKAAAFASEERFLQQQSTP